MITATGSILSASQTMGELPLTGTEYIPARKSQLPYYREIPLFYMSSTGKFVMYKPPGTTLFDMRVKKGRVPEKMYIRKSDKILGLQEVQKVFNRQLRSDVKSNNAKKVHETIVNIMEETLSEPRSGSLEGISQTVNILVSDYTRETDVIRNLLFVSNTDYTTILHSINVMALVIGYATQAGMSLQQKRVLGLCGLLHDVGKVKIDQHLLTAPRKLTDREFQEIKKHAVYGYEILNNCRFGNSEIKMCALQHHEKLDGSGYPDGRTDLAEAAKIIGFIDCYEALTNDDRPYRNAMDPMKALLLIKKDVAAGKFDKKVFETFAYSLA